MSVTPSVNEYLLWDLYLRQDRGWETKKSSRSKICACLCNTHVPIGVNVYPTPIVNTGIRTPGVQHLRHVSLSVVRHT